MARTRIPCFDFLLFWPLDGCLMCICVSYELDVSQGTFYGPSHFGIKSARARENPFSSSINIGSQENPYRRGDFLIISDSLLFRSFDPSFFFFFSSSSFLTSTSKSSYNMSAEPTSTREKCLPAPADSQAGMFFLRGFLLIIA